MADDARAVLAAPPRVPADVARFTSDALFGEPGIYPAGPPLRPAEGHWHSDTAIEEVLADLVGTAGEWVFEAWCAGRTAVTRLTYGTPVAPGRVVGPDAVGARVVNERYRAEDPRLLLPSIVHDLLWSGPGAGHAEETVLHALGAYVHAQLLARDPGLADRGTELARRQNSLAITLLNSRHPGSADIAVKAPDGPGTIPGGAPSMQTPDFWSIPFVSGTPVAADAPARLRAVLQRVTGATPPSRLRYDDALGDWWSSRGTRGALDHDAQWRAAVALGLLDQDGASGRERGRQSR